MMNNWRYEILVDAMNKIALTGNEVAKEALMRVQSRRQLVDARETQLLELLADGPMEILDIAVSMNLSRFNADRVVAKLRADRKVYLHSLKRQEGLTDGALRKVWAAGDKPDAVYEAKPRKDAKPRATPVKRTESPEVRDPMVAALFGKRDAA